MLRTKSSHLLQRLGRGLDDQVDAVAEAVSSKSVTSAADLDQGVVVRLRPGHLAVDPDDPVVGRALVGVLCHAPTIDAGCMWPGGARRSGHRTAGLIENQLLCALGRTRTCDLEIRRLLLYPAELRGHVPRGWRGQRENCRGARGLLVRRLVVRVALGHDVREVAMATAATTAWLGTLSWAKTVATVKPAGRSAVQANADRGSQHRSGGYLDHAAVLNNRARSTSLRWRRQRRTNLHTRRQNGETFGYSRFPSCSPSSSP